MRFESLGADPFLSTIEGFVSGVETVLEEEVEDDEAKGKFREKLLLSGKKRLGKDLQPVYQKWIQKSLADQDSRLWRIYEAWAETTAVAKLAKVAKDETGPLRLQDSLMENFAFLSVVSRVKDIEHKLGEMSADPPFPEEEAFKLFLVDQAWQDWDQEQTRKPTLFERLTGKPHKTPEDFLNQLLKGLAVDYASDTDQFGLTRKDRIRGTISSKQLQLSNNGKRPKPPKEEGSSMSIAGNLRIIRERLDGKMDTKEKIRAPKVQGLERFSERFKLTPGFGRCLSAMRPVLGRRSLVKAVVFEEDQARDHRDGQFDDEELRIEIFPEPGDQAKFVYALMHESGHAICPDRTLPLRDSIAFSMEMTEALKRSGFLSEYGLTSMLMVGAEMAKTMTFTSERDLEFMAARPLDEEWAEMVARVLTAPVTKHVFPEKGYIVRWCLMKFGVDCEEAEREVMAAALGQLPEEEREKVLSTAASPESSPKDIGRVLRNAALA